MVTATTVRVERFRNWTLRRRVDSVFTK
jgi:hypothetical protein